MTPEEFIKKHGHDLFNKLIDTGNRTGPANDFYLPFSLSQLIEADIVVDIIFNAIKTKVQIESEILPGCPRNNDHPCPLGMEQKECYDDIRACEQTELLAF
ncbi:MAG: hypothetical protein WCP18_04215 [bacterium]